MQKKGYIAALVLMCVMSFYNISSSDGYSLSQSSVFYSLWEASSPIEISESGTCFTLSNSSNPTQYFTAKYPNYLGCDSNEITFSFTITFESIKNTSFEYNGYKYTGENAPFVIQWSNTFNKTQHYYADILLIKSVNSSAISIGMHLRYESGNYIFIEKSDQYNISLNTKQNTVFTINSIPFFPVESPSLEYISKIGIYNRMFVIGCFNSESPVLSFPRIETNGYMPIPFYDITYNKVETGSYATINIENNNCGNKSGIYDASGKLLREIREDRIEYSVRCSKSYYTNETFYVIIYTLDGSVFDTIPLCISFNVYSVTEDAVALYNNILWAIKILGFGCLGLGSIVSIKKAFSHKKQVSLFVDGSLEVPNKIYTSSGSITIENSECQYINKEFRCNTEK